MAIFYDFLYDRFSLFSISVCISGRTIVGFQLMEWQTVIALVLGFLALVYAGWYFLRQFFQVEKKPECEDCPVPNQKGEKSKA